jgi:ubiquinone/menaquinone biosynthesis C-methylase UbiE
MTRLGAGKRIAEEIVAHYDAYDEPRRLTDGFGLFERERTMELIARYLPPAPAVVLDVGGAAGVYSFWMAGLGHEVHLVDITPRHVEQARERSAAPGSPRLVSLRVGDARALSFADEFADVVVMHGPLYHLTERGDRLQALAEARRVLRPGGVLLGFAITRYAGVVYGLTKGHVFDDEYMRMTVEEVGTGQRRDAPDWLGTFIRAYFHHPDELAAEVTEAGLAHERTLGVLGPAWLVPDLDACWADGRKRRRLMEVARLLEGEGVLGPRLMAVGWKGSGSGSPPSSGGGTNKPNGSVLGISVFA